MFFVKYYRRSKKNHSVIIFNVGNLKQKTIIIIQLIVRNTIWYNSLKSIKSENDKLKSIKMTHTSKYNQTVLIISGRVQVSSFLV